MIVEMIKANGCIFQDRYEREVSPAYRSGSSDALIKHMHLLVDERDAFKKIRALYQTDDGRPTVSVDTFGSPSEGLIKGIDAIIAKHDGVNRDHAAVECEPGLSSRQPGRSPPEAAV